MVLIKVKEQKNLITLDAPLLYAITPTGILYFKNEVRFMQWAYKRFKNQLLCLKDGTTKDAKP